MKRFAIAGAAIIVTFGLAIFAIAVAHRDSREREAVLEVVDPEYANQPSAPIAVAVETSDPGPATMDPLQAIAQFETSIGELEGPERLTQLDEPPAFPEAMAPRALQPPAPKPALEVFSEPALAKATPEGTTADHDSAAIALAADSQTSGNASAVAPAAPGLLSPPTIPGAKTAPAFPSGLPLPPLPLSSKALPTAPSTPGMLPAPSPFATPPLATGGNVATSVPAAPTAANSPSSSAATSAPWGGQSPPAFPGSESVAGQNPRGAPASATLLPPTAPRPAMTASTPPASVNPTPSSPLPSMVPDFAAQPPSRSASTPPAGLPGMGLDSRPANPAIPSTSAGLPASTSAAAARPTESFPRSPSTAAPPDAARAGWGGAGTLGALANQHSPLVSPAPGSRQIDGTQNPSLQIQKKAPEEVQVGQAATFALVVRNVGNATAYEVVVSDQVPRGTRLSKTSPQAEQRTDGTLLWSLGEMAAGSEQVLTVELIPEMEGEIGSVASVNFAAQASVRTVSTQPKLVVKQVADQKILLGEALRIDVTVTNEGTGVARAVSLEEDVPQGLRHPLGNALGVPLGDLAPGQAKTTRLELVAVEPGNLRNTMRAIAANTEGSDSTVELEVVAPRLQVDASGPRLRYLERQATYQVAVVNAGTSTAYEVGIIAYLPRGLQYNSSGNHGEYIAEEHAVHWALEELPVGATATTEMTLLPVEEGEFAIRLHSRAVGVEAQPLEKQVRIEGQSELAFSIDDDNDPIEVDGQTTYLVRLSNSGTRLDEEVQVMVELPQGSRVLQVNAPVDYRETPQGLIFEPIPQMKAKDQHSFRFSVQWNREGVQIVRAHVKSKLRPLPVVKEESTEVYRDQ